MSAKFDISFETSADIAGGYAILLQAGGADLAAGAKVADPAGVIARAAKIAGFSAKPTTVLDLVAPEGSAAERLFVVGLGKPEELTAHDWLKAGGVAALEDQEGGKGCDLRRCAGCRRWRQRGRGFCAWNAVARLQLRYLQDEEERRRRQQPERTGGR